MDLLNLISPTHSMELTYYGFEHAKLESTVRVDLFPVLADYGRSPQLYIVATEVEHNDGPSVTNSIEQLARRVYNLFPTFDFYQIIESYRYPGEEPTFDLVSFKEGKPEFNNPSWRRMNDNFIRHTAQLINANPLHDEGSKTKESV